MRGIPLSPIPATPFLRISPAHAGNTGVSGGADPRCGDQPRTCGEYRQAMSQSSTAKGSAPHMRGIRSMGVLLKALQRISPAHAGNTCIAQMVLPRPMDQPRTCGEYSAAPDGPGSAAGSAPHMRGIQLALVPCQHRRGISPAHAGNTDGAPVKPDPFRDQPRTCGEYSDADAGPDPGGQDQPRTCGEYSRSPAQTRRLIGSAPHMRGILWEPVKVWAQTRISPAHAGNTLGQFLPDLDDGDQPRTCGEYHIDDLEREYDLGSAPHMRGIPARGCGSRRTSRISPAHAGNTPTAVSGEWSGRDQPRTCGEY